MEMINGGELLNYFSNNNLTEKEIAKIMKQVVEAIDYLHSCGIMHRDLKPENILIQFQELELSDDTCI